MFIDSDINFNPKDVFVTCGAFTNKKINLSLVHTVKNVLHGSVFVTQLMSVLLMKILMNYGKFTGDFVFDPVLGTQELSES